MYNYLKNNLQFIILIIVWLTLGIYLKPVVFVLLPLSFVLLWKKAMYGELLIGFFAVLIFSDSFYLGFAKDIKPVILLFLGFFFIFNQKEFYPINTLTSPFVAFFVFSFLVLFNSVTLALSFQKTFSYIVLYLVVPNYITFIFRKEGVIFFKKIVFFAVIILVAGFVLNYLNPHLTISHGTRYKGIFGNPNGVAMFSVLIYFLFSVVNEYYPGLFNRIEKIIIYLSIFISIIWSGSRSSIMCLFIFWIFSMVQKRSLILGVILFIVIIISFQVISNNFIEIVKRLDMAEYLRIDTIKEGSGRVFAWNYAWEEIQKNFFFGRGFDYNQYLFFIPETQQKLNMLNHQGDVHNVYLGFWLDVGLIGLILYFGAFFYTFYKANKKSHLALPIMYSMLFMGNFEPWLIASLNPYTIQFLIIATTLIYCKKEHDSKDQVSDLLPGVLRKLN